MIRAIARLSVRIQHATQHFFARRMTFSRHDTSAAVPLSGIHSARFI
jgi:hypothetical protein